MRQVHLSVMVLGKPQLFCSTTGKPKSGEITRDRARVTCKLCLKRLSPKLRYRDVMGMLNEGKSVDPARVKLQHLNYEVWVLRAATTQVGTEHFYFNSRPTAARGAYEAFGKGCFRRLMQDGHAEVAGTRLHLTRWHLDEVLQGLATLPHDSEVSHASK